MFEEISRFQTSRSGRNGPGMASRSSTLASNLSLSLSFRQMSIKESVLWFNIRHAGILPFEGVFQIGADMDRAYLVSPFLEYGTVTDFVRSHQDVDRRLLVCTPSKFIIPYAILKFPVSREDSGRVQCNRLPSWQQHRAWRH